LSNFPVFIFEFFMSDISNYGGRLSELRERAGLTIAELARKVNLSPDAISKLQSGVRKPGLETALNIAEVFGVSIYDMLTPPKKRHEKKTRGRPKKKQPETNKPKRPRGRPKKKKDSH